ncbi:MAG: hypothetical protein Kow00133_13700 [Amphiplicatus sp.]
MPRILIPVAALMLMAGPALAAPGFGASSWSVSGEASSTASESDKLGLFEMLARLVGAKPAVSSQLTAGAEAGAHPSVVPSDQACEEQSQSKAAKRKEKKTAANKQPGPEPVYLAF